MGIVSEGTMDLLAEGGTPNPNETSGMPDVQAIVRENVEKYGEALGREFAGFAIDEAYFRAAGRTPVFNMEALRNSCDALSNMKTAHEVLDKAGALIGTLKDTWEEDEATYRTTLALSRLASKRYFELVNQTPTPNAN